MFRIFICALIMVVSVSASAAGWFDTNFAAPEISGMTRQLSGGPPGENGGRGGIVMGIHRIDDGRFYISGTFTNVGGAMRVGIARMMPNGQLDQSFVANRYEGSTNLFVKIVGGNESVCYAEVSYFFGTYLEAPTPTNLIVKIWPDGAITDFLFGSTNTVLAVQKDGKILVASGFSKTSSPQVIRRLNPDGSLDPEFRAIRIGFSTFSSSGPRMPVVTFLNGGDIIITVAEISSVTEEQPGGGFGAQVNVFGTGAIRISSAGKWDSVFRFGSEICQVLEKADKQLVFRVSRPPSGFVEQGPRSIILATSYGIGHPYLGTNESFAPNGADTLIEAADGYLYRMGNDASLFRYSGDGFKDTNFAVSIAHSNPPSVEIRSVVPVPDGSVLVGGAFTSVDGIPARGLFRIRPASWMGAPTIDFAMGQGVIAESVEPHQVLLRRIGDTNGAVGVTVGVKDGTANTADLAQTSWAVNFLPGEVTKRFPLHAIYDGLFESRETLTLSLSNPTGGAALGAQSTSQWLIYNRDIKIVPLLPIDQVVPSGMEISLPLDTSVLEPEFFYASIEIQGLDRPAELDVVATNYSGVSVSLFRSDIRIPTRLGLDGFGPRRLKVSYRINPRNTSDINVVGGNLERTIVVDDRRPNPESLQGLLVRSPRVGRVSGVGSAVFGYVTNLGATANSGVAFFDVNTRRVRVWQNTSIQSGQINSALVQTDGRLVLGGSFADISGQPKAYLARVLPDGSLDQAFANGSPNGVVESLFTLTDGRILVSGSFTQLGGQPRNGVAIIDGNGLLDAGFDPAFAAGALRLVKVLSDGSFYANRGNTNLLRFFAVGTPDTGFLTTLNSTVQSLEVEADGRILISGGFNQVNGQARSTIARLNSDGSLAGFQAGYPVFDGQVTKLMLQPDGKILLCGYFSTINGQRRARIARLGSDGVLDAGFVPTAEPSNLVSSMDFLADGSVLIGGDFDRVGNRFRLGLARLSDKGALLPDAPQIALLRSAPEPVVRFDSEPGQNYRIQKSSGLSEWAPAGEITAAGFSTTFTNSSQLPSSGEFYRILANP